MSSSRLTCWASRVSVLGSMVFLLSCGSGEEGVEAVQIEGLLPEAAVTEITHAYPDFAVALVPAAEANVGVTFGERSMRVDGIGDAEVRERIAGYVLQYMENPNKAAEDRAAREAYEALPPQERLAALIERIRERYPDFEYEWTGLGEGNVTVEYGDNSLLMMGIEDAGAREEWAHAIIQIQREIDAMESGEGQGGV